MMQLEFEHWIFEDINLIFFSCDSGLVIMVCCKKIALVILKYSQVK